MYTIGEVSKIVNISANTLRYYDEIGLLKPSYIQNNNQYRYYSDNQIKDITFIMEMKQYGFTLYEIKDLLQNKDKQKIKFMLEEKRTEIHNEIARLKENSVLLEKRITKIMQEEDLNMKGRRVLIVDDLELARILIRNTMEGYGYTMVGEASNGEEAIKAYEQFKPDIVIMDVTMPIMDGIDAAAKIIEKYKDARIIMCSAFSYAPVVLESIKVGAKDFVSKPFSSVTLMNALIRVYDDNHNLNIEKINDITNKIKRNTEEAIYNRALTQEEIDTLLHKIINGNEQEKFIFRFLDKIKCDFTKEKEQEISKPLLVEEKMIECLKDKFEFFSKALSFNMCKHINKDCTIKLLSIENVTVGEFKALMDNTSSTGEIKHKEHCLPIYIHTYGEFENQQKIIRELLNFTIDNLKHELCDYSIITDLNSEQINSLEADYPTILVSFSVEFSEEDKGFAAISVPHSLLQEFNFVEM